jgi:hypothetical protein
MARLLLTGTLSTLFSLGCLERRQQHLIDAQNMYENAQEVWLKGGKMKTHHFNGACTYKLGCMAYELGDPDKAT